MLSGQPEVGLSLVAAGELAWLGFVGTHPRFRKFVDIQEHQKLRKGDAEEAATRMRRMLTSMPRGAQRRFQELKQQCEELRKITKQYQIAHADEFIDDTAVELRLEGLDKLLWLFLKLLHTENALNRYFETTNIDTIEHEIRQLKDRIEREADRPEQAQRERIVATLRANLETCEERKRNFNQARDSYELIKAEQRRLENKIRSLAEMGISQRKPAVLSDQVDSVAGSIQETEATLNELRFVTGFSTFEDEAVPEIVNRRTITTHQ